MRGVKWLDTLLTTHIKFTSAFLLREAATIIPNTFILLLPLLLWLLLLFNVTQCQILFSKFSKSHCPDLLKPLNVLYNLKQCLTFTMITSLPVFLVDYIILCV